LGGTSGTNTKGGPVPWSKKAPQNQGYIRSKNLVSGAPTQLRSDIRGDGAATVIEVGSADDLESGGARRMRKVDWDDSDSDLVEPYIKEQRRELQQKVNRGITKTTVSASTEERT
jgi:hypothetical protein